MPPLDGAPEGRSSYIAAAMPDSGGIVGNFTLDSTHVPAVITAHGPPASDMVTVYFQTTSLDEDNELATTDVRNCTTILRSIVAEWDQ